MIQFVFVDDEHQGIVKQKSPLLSCQCCRSSYLTAPSYCNLTASTASPVNHLQSEKIPAA